MNHKSLWAGAALCGALLLSVVAPLPQVRADFTDFTYSNYTYTPNWTDHYNNTMTEIYNSNMNLITRQAIENSQMYSNVISSNVYATTGSSARARRVRSMAQTERSEAQRFAQYNGQMYSESKSLDTPGQIAAIFAKDKLGTTQKLKPVFVVMRDLYKTRAKQQGAPYTDVARALAYAIAVNYYAFSATQPTEAQIAALRLKMRTSLSESSAFRRASAAQKQQVAESAVIMAHLVVYGVEDVATKAPPEKRSLVLGGFRKLAGVNLKGLLGVDAKRVSFNKDGLLIKPA